MHKIVWTELANEEFEEVLWRIERKWGVNTKNNLLDILEDCIKQLQNDLLHHTFVNKKHNVKKCLVTKHNTLLFTKTKDTIIILRFFVNKRKPEVF